MTDLHLADAAEAGRSSCALTDVRHTFLSSPNPRTTSCARCGKSAGDTVHAFLDVGLQAAVRAHLTVAANHAATGDFGEAVREAKVAIRLAGLED